eukprot:TRINITY_DN4157_c0_g1_i2.p1 TRINITY_DN4157_c0_g1~~TRINITY_DN4157_c0_g1_i2.p1  ORF type:complete len:404 (+),score=30.35 TRINITY_DN4157_c0_g1_i2:268-1479(+)
MELNPTAWYNTTDNSSVTVIGTAVFAGGSSTIDDTPQIPIEYYDCEQRQDKIDLLGILEFSGKYIPAADRCDGIFDCDNLTDEDSYCSTSLYEAEIIILAITGALIIVVTLVYLFLLFFFKRKVVRKIGVLWLTGLYLATVVGLSSIFAFWGKDSVATCSLRIWMSSLAGCFLLTFLSLRQFSWWKIRPTNLSSRIDPKESFFESNVGREATTSIVYQTPLVEPNFGQPSRIATRKFRDGWQSSRIWWVSGVFAVVMLVLNAVILTVLTAGYIETKPNERCGSNDLLIWIGVLVAINSVPLLLGCTLSWLVHQNGPQRYFVLSIYHSLCLGLFLLTLFFSLYKTIPLASRVIGMCFIMLLFFNAFMIITMSTVYRLLVDKKEEGFFGSNRSSTSHSSHSHGKQ